MISLWMACLDRPLQEAETRRLMASLPGRRRERLERLKEKDWQREPLCAYWLLRRALRERFGWRELPDMEHAPSGKPYFPTWPGVYFSISHTDGVVLAGIADREIGVDVERIRPVKERVLRRFGCDGENVFFDLWVRREARAKRLGTPVELGDESPLLLGEQIIYPECFAGYTACAAWLGEETPEVCRLTMEELLRDCR